MLWIISLYHRRTLCILMSLNCPLRATLTEIRDNRRPWVPDDNSKKSYLLHESQKKKKKHRKLTYASCSFVLAYSDKKNNKTDFMCFTERITCCEITDYRYLLCHLFTFFQTQNTFDFTTKCWKRDSAHILSFMIRCAENEKQVTQSGPLQSLPSQSLSQKILENINQGSKEHKLIRSYDRVINTW